jgi:hypothetical protein
MPKASKSADRPASVVLKPKKQVVADALLDGATIREAAAAAELCKSSVEKMKRAPDVRQYIEQNQKELSNLTNLKRGDIIAGMMEAIDMAKLGADAGSMIRGYTEIAKMLGLYAPEVKVVQISMSQRAIANKYEAMSDEDLLKIAEGNVIEGESVRVQ